MEHQVSPLRALLVEDSAIDAELVVSHLRRDGLPVRFERVETAETLQEALSREPWDIVLSDYRLPHLRGEAVLQIVRTHSRELPLIFVSGAIGDALAVSLLKAGGDDYVMKDQLARLPASVRRELAVAAERDGRRRADEALRESEQRLRQMAENIGDVFYLVDAGHERLHYVSPAYEQLWGRSCGALYADPRAWTDAVHAEDRECLLAQRRGAERTGRFLSRYRITRPDGGMRWVEERGFAIRDEAGRMYRIAGVAEDITERVRLEEELRESERLKGAILDASLDCLITVDERGNVVEFNPAAEATFGIPRREALGRPIAELIVPERYRGSHERGFARYLAGGEGPLIGNRLELTAQRADGSEFPVELAITALKAGTGVSGPRTMFAACLRDITARREAEARILRLNRVYATLSAINATIVRVRGREELFREACRIAAEHGDFGIAWVDEIDAHGARAVPVAWAGADADMRMQQMAPQGTDTGGGLLGKVLRERKPAFINDLALEADEDAPRRTEAVKRGYRSLIALPIMTGDAVAAVLALLSREPQFFDEDEVRLLSQLAVDISVALDNIEKSERLNYLACFDALTGLSNRTLFLEHVSQYMHAASSGSGAAALAVLDVERFRAVNDSLGRAAGDELLTQISERLRVNVAETNQLSRLGSDLFALVLPGVRSESDAGRRLAALMRACFQAPFQLGQTELRVAAKAGVALFPGDGADAETLLRNAEGALKRCKRTGERQLFFEQRMAERVAQNLELENRLRRALEREELVLHYQPRVDLRSGRIEGVEALMRWKTEAGLVPPAQFIPLLEETGLILEAGAWALERAVLDRAQWLAQGLPAPRVAVNVSAAQLRGRDFVEKVKRTLALDPGSPAPGIDLEITESMVMDDVEANIGRLRALRALGLNLSIDDFGTGYSSLAYLARLPVSALKIDRSFVVAMPRESSSMTIVSAIVSLAHGLRLKVVAEGVDDEEQARLLRLLGCDEMQGYLYSPPLPAEELILLLRKMT